MARFGALGQSTISERLFTQTTGARTTVRSPRHCRPAPRVGAHPFTGTDGRDESDREPGRAQGAHPPRILDAALRMCEDSSLVPCRCARWPRRPASCRPRSTATSTPSSARPRAGRRVLRVAARDAARRTPQRPRRLDDVIDSSVRILDEHVHRRRAHFAFIAARAHRRPARRARGDRHEIQLCERELAADLGPAARASRRCGRPRDLRVPVEPNRDGRWSATAENILEAGGRPYAPRRPPLEGRPTHAAAHRAGRRPQLEVPHLASRLDPSSTDTV